MRSYLTVSARALVLPCAALLAVSCRDREPVAPQAIAPPTASVQAPPAAQGSVRHVVTLRGAEGRDFEQAVQAHGGQVERELYEINVVTVTGLSPAAAAALAVRPDVEDITPDLAVQWIPPVDQTMQRVELATPGAAAQGTDQSGARFFNRFQWNMRVTKADKAWSTTPGGHGALVCILDTGVDPFHIDLFGKIEFASSTSFVSTEPFIEDLNSHGTFVSAIVTSNGL